MSNNDTSAIDKLTRNIGQQDTDLIKSLEMLISDKFIEGKTVLNNRQVTAISMMNWAGQVYDIPFLREFVATWVKYRISGDSGRGRDDIIKIAQAIQLNKEVQDKQLQDILSKR